MTGRIISNSSKVSLLRDWDGGEGNNATAKLSPFQETVIQQMAPGGLGGEEVKRCLPAPPQNLPSMTSHISGRLSSSLKDTSASNEPSGVVRKGGGPSSSLSAGGGNLKAPSSSAAAGATTKTGATSASGAGAAGAQHPQNHFRSGKHFMEWVYKAEAELDRRGDCEVNECCDQLQASLSQIHRLLDKVNAGLKSVDTLANQYAFVEEKSNSLHTACQSLMTEQEQLSRYSQDVTSRLTYYNEVEGLAEKLGTPSFSIHSDYFAEALNKIDNCVTFLAQEKPGYANSAAYVVRYRAALSRALGIIRDYVRTSFTEATAASSANSLLTSDDTFALFYGKFKAQVPKVEHAISLVEARDNLDPSNALHGEYNSALQDCQAVYFNCRNQLLWPSVRATVSKLGLDYRGNHCGLMRAGCSLLLHVSEDENRLFKQFFKRGEDSEFFRGFLDGLCVLFYDTVRPLIVSLQHLETLSELTSILRTEMLEHCSPPTSSTRQSTAVKTPTSPSSTLPSSQAPPHLRSFEAMVGQMLQDVQERLIFRSHVYIRSDIAEYRPHPGDLSYPEKLEMMEAIQDSLNNSKNAEQAAVRQRCGSTSSSVSVASMEVANINSNGHTNSTSSSSPVDLHGMWYPTVRRSLVCLSRLYRCLELEIFQGLAQEVLNACTGSLQLASSLISERKGLTNGQLFLIKHLLILREQMTPFQVQLAVTEHSLDFTKLKTAALNLLSPSSTPSPAAAAAGNSLHPPPPIPKSALPSQNAIIKYLIEGAIPEVKEHCVDSRRELDQRLKRACEKFIGNSVEEMVGPLKALTEKIKNFRFKEPQAKLSTNPWGQPETVRDVVTQSQRNIKKRFPAIQRSLRLYLCNKETEFILFRPIRNDVTTAFMVLIQLLTSEFTEEERVIVALPSQEQVAMLLASLQIQQQQATPTPTPERPVSNGAKTPVAAATTPVSPAVETTPS